MSAKDDPLRAWRAPAEVVPLDARVRDDAELVARAREGERWAMEALFRRHVRQVAGTAVRLLGRHEEAEDVVQETFATAFAALGTLRDGAAVRGWLMQIAVRKIHRIFRRRRLLRLLGFQPGYDDATLTLLADPSAGPEVRAELALVDEALAKLPGPVRTAWMLRCVEGESLEDVARISGCSLATAKRRIRAAQDHVDAHVRGGGPA